MTITISKYGEMDQFELNSNLLFNDKYVLKYFESVMDLDHELKFYGIFKKGFNVPEIVDVDKAEKFIAFEMVAGSPMSLFGSLNIDYVSLGMAFGSFHNEFNSEVPLHLDIHKGNLAENNGVIYLFDFGCCRFGTRFEELESFFKKNGLLKFRKFLFGYNQTSEIPVKITTSCYSKVLSDFRQKIEQ